MKVSRIGTRAQQEGESDRVYTTVELNWKVSRIGTRAQHEGESDWN